MRKYISQIMIAFVCLLLGFMMAYQFKEINFLGDIIVEEDTRQSYYDLNADNEQLEKIKNELTKSHAEIMDELTGFEAAATEDNQASIEIKNELDNSRVLLGMKDVEGTGVIIYLTPKSSIFSNLTYQYLNYKEIAYLINELHFAKAEAIAVNDNRIVSQSVIKASNDEFLVINDNQISSKERIVVKVIGNKEKLEEYLNFPDVLNFEALANYDIKIEKSDNITISKYDKDYKSDFID